MIEMKKSCAFTGHRPSGFVFGYHEQDERCLRLKRALFDKITALAQTGTRIFYTGMAEGGGHLGRRGGFDPLPVFSGYRADGRSALQRTEGNNEGGL